MHGLVETREGKGGGASLAKPADRLLLSDIYRAVNAAPLLGKANRPNPDSPVFNEQGRSILSVEDLAVAIVDEIEQSKHSRQRFTAAY